MKASIATAWLVAFGLAAALSYPLIAHPASMGRIDAGDAQFSVWNTAWVAHALVDDPRHLFDANIFYPHTGTLAYSEANLVAGALAAPAYALTRNPIVAHNAAVYSALVLAFVAMWALVRRLTGSPGAAYVSATGFTFSPFVASWTTEIQLLMVFGIPTTFFAFHRFADRPGGWRAAMLGLSLALAGLACAYYGIFTGLGVGFAALWFSRGQHHLKRYWIGLGVAALVAAAAVALPIRPFLELRSQPGARGTFNSTEAAGYSATPGEYLRSPSRVDQLFLRPRAGNDVLFPGALVAILGCAGLVLSGVSGQGSRDSSANRRRIVGCYALLAALAAWASFGPAAGLYSALARVVPLMGFLRAPARFGVLVVFGLAVLAGFGVERLRERLKAAWLPAVLTALTAVEVAAVPWPWRPVPPAPLAYRELAVLPRGPVIAFHFPYQRTDYFHHTTYMFWSMWSWQPLVNGYSDFIPADFDAIARPINGFPDRESFKLLEARHVRYVIVDLTTYGAGEARDVLLARFPPYREYLRPIVQTGDVWLFEIVKWP